MTKERDREDRQGGKVCMYLLYKTNTCVSCIPKSCYVRYLCMMKKYSYTYCLMSWIASSYFIPLSIRARATSTGALCAWINTHRVMSEESYLCKIQQPFVSFRNRTIRSQQLSQFYQQTRLKSISVEMSMPQNLLAGIMPKGIIFLPDETGNHR